MAQPKTTPAAPVEAKPAQIDRNGVLILIRTTLLERFPFSLSRGGAVYAGVVS